MRLRVSHLLSLVVLACEGGAQGGALQPVPPGPPQAQVEAVLQRDESRFIAIRRDLHRNPELSGEERRTAQVVADAMRRLGLEVRTGVGGHGVVARLRGGRPGPVIAYRADMDAVATNDRDPVEFRSLHAGIRHICGHDLHTTIGIAIATALHQVRDSLAGEVLFVFQPAEERATGAKAMLADGVFAVPPAAIYGLHTAPLESGRVSTSPGPMMAGRDRFDISISATGDIQVAAAAVRGRLLALGTMDASQITINQPKDFVLVQAQSTTFSGNTARIAGVVTVASDLARGRVREAISNGLGVGLATGDRVSATYEARWIAGVTNDSALVMAAAERARQVLGAGNVSIATTIPPAFSEDFGSFQERVPGVFLFLGVANAANGWNGLPHHPDYVADERAILVGARTMSAVILRHLLP
jgi:metal-dependent amidase/aminoacylase/carboxypeptidase family protein